LYQELLRALAPLGAFEIEVNSRDFIRANNTCAAEQVSKNRWHLDVRLMGAADIDAEFLTWLREAYEIC
jgi:hypothetical protein